MRRVLAALVFLVVAGPAAVQATPVGYSLTVTTAYAAGDPFPSRIDTAFTGAATGFFQIQNSGDTTFAGTVGTIALSAFAGDLSFTSGALVLEPGASISVAIPFNAEVVGGFNGPAYEFRPGVQITLNGTISNGLTSEPVALLVADADIHSGVTRTDGFGLSSDSFVLQGGDPWGFQTDDPFALSQADGVYVFAESAAEPSSGAVLAGGLLLVAAGRLAGRSGARRERTLGVRSPAG